MDKLYSIIEVATKLNLSDKTLRRWEEAGKFMPSRTLGNQRRYTLEDLQILDAIKHGTINEQKDLLTVAQASKLCGVSTTTILRWEETGRIHPFITSGNTYYPRQQLMAKMDELKNIYVEPVPEEPMSLEGSVLKRNPRLQAEGASSSVDERTDPKVGSTPKLTPLSTPLQSTHTQDNLQFAILNTLITLILILSYHLIFNQSSVPISPQSGSVQGVSNIVTPDPRLDDLITQFKNHLSAEMLKDAKPVSTTIKVADSTLVTATTTLSKGKDQITVAAENITETTPVTVTFTSDFSPAKKYWVTPGQGSFTLHTDFPLGSDATFNYSFLTPTSTPSASIIRADAKIIN